MNKAPNILADYLFNKAVDMAITSTVASFPFLALPVVNQIYVYVVKKTASNLYKNLKKLGFNIKVDIEIAKQTDAYKSASKKLKKVFENEYSTDSEIKKASDEFDDSLRDLIVF